MGKTSIEWTDRSINPFRARNKDPEQWTQVDLKGSNPAEWPEDLRVREFPEPAKVTA